MNLLEVMFRGGVVMWPILLCFLLTLFVTLERWSVLRRRRFDSSQFLPRLKSLYRHGDISAVLSYCSQKDAAIANIVRRGVLKRSLGVASIREAVENAAREEQFRLERHLGLLASMTGIAPMLGFFGSIVGLIMAFQSIEHSGGLVVPTDLAGGIWQALLPTAFGLIVGVIALIGYNGCTSRVNTLVHEMESASNEFLDLLDEPSGEHNGDNGNELQMLMRSQLAEQDPFQRKE
jgi:biopolymer transport protein ExbB